MQTLGRPEQPLWRKGDRYQDESDALVNSNGCKVAGLSGEDDLMDSRSGIAGTMLRESRIGSQAHSVALSAHSPDSIGPTGPFYIGFLSLKMPCNDPTTAYDSHGLPAGPLPPSTCRS
jgi:hypothetical protein